ncbi:hypothetical protein FRC00_010168 [Tulasnella sp. 408]|nr:hypothetical protein FRC00_010168 [Tulasnella sp. 408]
MSDLDIDIEELNNDPFADEPESLPSLSQIEHARASATTNLPTRRTSQRLVGASSSSANPRADQDTIHSTGKKNDKIVATGAAAADAHDGDEAPSQAGKATSKKSSTGKRKKASTENEGGSAIIQSFKIPYTVTCVALTCLTGKKGKPLKSPQGTKTEVLSLSDDEPFDTFKAQLLALFSRNFKSVKNKNEWKWFDVCWSITRLHTTPTSLRTQPDFEVLLKKARRGEQTEVKIRMTERSKEYRDDDDVPSSESESSDESSEDERKKKKRKKADEIPAHEAQEAEYQLQLEEKWACTDPKCPSRVCWICKDHGGIHIPLTAKEYSIWTAGMMKGPATATVDSPPNHHYFDPDPNSRTPLLASRQGNLSTSRNQFQAPPAQGPPVHIHNYLNGAPTVSDAPAALPPAIVPAVNEQPANTLARRGPPMLLDEFGKTFGLLPSVIEKFRAHDITDAAFLNFLPNEEIRTTLGLSIGEYGNFLFAKEKWENAAVV